MIKKIVLTVVSVMIIALGAQAQRGFRANLSVHGNFGSGISDISSLEGALNDAAHSGNMAKISSKIPSFGVGLSAGYAGKVFLLDANIRLNYGTTVIEGSHNQQFDKIAYLSAGLRILKIGPVELEAKLGYGVSLTDFSLKEIDSKLQSSTMIMPLSATIWIGETHAMHNRFGISFEYIFSVGNLHDIQYKGVGDFANTVAHELKIAPNTMNVSLRYQF